MGLNFFQNRFNIGDRLEAVVYSELAFLHCNLMEPSLLPGIEGWL
jgi:hypothetical protein